MRGSAVARVEYRLSAPTPPLCFLRNWQSGVLEKNMIANQYEWTAFGCEVAPRSEPLNIRRPIRNQTELFRDETNQRSRVFRENAPENSTRAYHSTEENAFEMPTPAGAFSENHEAVA
jgi:hypothetical protein